ncbi:MAG: hypothetical protein OCD03_06360 [Hyphomicrobiales bacterium]
MAFTASFVIRDLIGTTQERELIAYAKQLDSRIENWNKDALNLLMKTVCKLNFIYCPIQASSNLAMMMQKSN